MRSVLSDSVKTQKRCFLVVALMCWRYDFPFSTRDTVLVLPLISTECLSLFNFMFLSVSIDVIPRAPLHIYHVYVFHLIPSSFCTWYEIHASSDIIPSASLRITPCCTSNDTRFPFNNIHPASVHITHVLQLIASTVCMCFPA